MSSKEWYRDNWESNQFTYQVLSELARHEEGSYGSKIKADLNKGAQADISRVLSALHEEGLTVQGKRTQARYYLPDFSQLAKICKEYLGLEQEIPTDFMKGYVKKYTAFQKNSTIRRMLREDFVAAVKSYHREGHDDAPEWFEELAETLESESPEFRAPAEFVEDAFDEQID